MVVILNNYLLPNECLSLSVANPLTDQGRYKQSTYCRIENSIKEKTYLLLQVSHNYNR